MPSSSSSPRRLVLASGNAKKLVELRTLLADLHVEVVAQSALGIPPAAEPHASFVENALAKARHAAALARGPALADDSGLCCRALAGAPGVRSARFAGADASDARNNAALVERLAGVADRRAHYYCVVVALRGADDPEPLIADGSWDGEFRDIPRGAEGFGYDPHFWLASHGCTVAELDAAVKNRISHRAQAMSALAAALRARWSW